MIFLFCKEVEGALAEGGGEAKRGVDDGRGGVGCPGIGFTQRRKDAKGPSPVRGGGVPLAITVAETYSVGRQSGAGPFQIGVADEAGPRSPRDTAFAFRKDSRPPMDIRPALTQASEMQKRMLRLQEELGRLEVSHSVAGGMVTVTMSGHKRVLALKIDPETLDGDVEMTEDMVLAAFNGAAEKVDDLVGRRTEDIMAEFPLAADLQPPLA